MASGPYIYFPMSWSRTEEASEYAVEVASRLGLNCYDPQLDPLRDDSRSGALCLRGSSGLFGVALSRPLPITATPKILADLVELVAKAEKDADRYEATGGVVLAETGWATSHGRQVRTSVGAHGRLRRRGADAAPRRGDRSPSDEHHVNELVAGWNPFRPATSEGRGGIVYGTL
ncbi:hypothetical protein GCM10011574_12500 [Microbispora bryophytorum]|uniref:Uncharacterized protein n=1 Tax=Microbispora bryophytorum TaxID=1460882 RepID=A0A8H9H1B8_9ACTN|nr:hypothetical protein GCM10011574_12500 [Microbispora bryophytorum]